MAVVVTVEIPGGSPELEQAMLQELGVLTSPPTGLHFRAGGPIPGGWRVITGWESPERFQGFQREKLQPAFDKLGLRPSRIEMWPVGPIQVNS